MKKNTGWDSGAHPTYLWEISVYLRNKVGSWYGVDGIDDGEIGGGEL